MCCWVIKAAANIKFVLLGLEKPERYWAADFHTFSQDIPGQYNYCSNSNLNASHSCLQNTELFYIYYILILNLQNQWQLLHVIAHLEVDLLQKQLYCSSLWRFGHQCNVAWHWCRASDDAGLADSLGAAWGWPRRATRPVRSGCCRSDQDHLSSAEIPL